MFDIEKIAKSIVGFSDYFSLRIILLLLSCYLAYRYAWSPDYYQFTSRIHADLIAAINAFSNDKLLGLFKLEVIVPFLFLFVFISLLDIHMKVLAFISRLFPFTFSLTFREDYPLAVNEPTIFYEWTKVSGTYDYFAYRGMVIRDFYDDLGTQDFSYTYGTVASLIHYLLAYGLILFAGAILFPSIFVNSARWHILATAFTLMLVSIFSGLLEQLLHYIKSRQVIAYKFSDFARKYNALKQIPNIERPQAVEDASPPKAKGRLELFECFVPSIRVQILLPTLAVQYDFRPCWERIRDRVLKVRTKRSGR